MTRIFLIGYMGAGKTTLGKAFAREMSLNFIDLDWFIEERFHKTVQQLFLERGEDGFRELERKMLHEVAEFEDVVVSTGGGTPCFFDNMEYMNDCGDTVFLDVEPAVLFRRLRVAKQHIVNSLISVLKRIQCLCQRVHLPAVRIFFLIGFYHFSHYILQLFQ